MKLSGKLMVVIVLIALTAGMIPFAFAGNPTLAETILTKIPVLLQMGVGWSSGSHYSQGFRDGGRNG